MEALMSMQVMNWNAGQAQVQDRVKDQVKASSARNLKATRTIRRLRAQYVQERLHMAHNAYIAHHLYLELGTRAKTANCKALYQRLSEVEQRHLFRHTMRLKKLGENTPKFRRSWFSKLWHRVLVACGPAYVHKWLAHIRRGETRRQIEVIRRRSNEVNAADVPAK
jgi:hypothetical protein